MSDITSMVNELSREAKIELLAETLGFRQLPPTIEEFVNDPYYLGNSLGNGILYPYWLEHLKDIYPDPITTRYRYIVIKGAIGTGKSTISKIMALYDKCKMMYLEDAYRTLIKDPSTLFTIRAFNLSKAKAFEVLVDPMREWEKMSPFFKEYPRDHEICKISIDTAKRASDVISECLIFALISEVNFFSPEVADLIIKTCESRMKSRLTPVEGIFGHIILDSSSTQLGSVVEKFIANNKYASQTKIITTNTWEAHAHEGYYFKHGSFKVFIGNSVEPPRIIKKGEDISDIDTDKIIIVPEELRPNFSSDIYLALNDQAGISLDSQNDFFPDKTIINKAMNIEQSIDDELIIDFFDDEQIYDVIGDYVLASIPEDRKVYGSIDLGLTGDLCGIAASYIDGADYEVIENRKIYRPSIKTPLAIGLSRKPGQETSIEKIINFWVWLSAHREIAIITTDNFQSSGIRQEFTKLKIKTALLSVDRNDIPYTNMKKLMLKDKLSMVNSQLLYSELSNLVRVGVSQVDHKSTSSKDIADAVCRTIQSILNDGKDSAQPAQVQVGRQYNNIVKQLAERNKLNRYRGFLMR